MKTKVKELRTAARMTQQQLADLVHVSSRTIISIEKEQYSPSLMLAYRMAEVFGVTVEELCCLKENKELEDKNGLVSFDVGIKIPHIKQSTRHVTHRRQTSIGSAGFIAIIIFSWQHFVNPLYIVNIWIAITKYRL